MLSSFLILLISSSLFSFLFIPSLTFHGYTNQRISKNYFFIFYLTGVIVVLNFVIRSNNGQLINNKVNFNVYFKGNFKDIFRVNFKGIFKGNFKDIFKSTLKVNFKNNYLKHPFSIHLYKRLFESLVLKYSKHNKMSVIHLLTGIVYYLLLTDYLLRFKVSWYFLIFSFLQFFGHLKVRGTNKNTLNRNIFKNLIRLIFKYPHYLSEICIYLIIFLEIKSLELFLNLIWVIVFVFISV
ncbi:hypothetical protein DMUE_2800 [Dictyocoela muelleri]|nr:hypothetical protein DMUE_2800 [Dictyocoela muelleri]